MRVCLRVLWCVSAWGVCSIYLSIKNKKVKENRRLRHGTPTEQQEKTKGEGQVNRTRDPTQKKREAQQLYKNAASILVCLDLGQMGGRVG